MPDSTNVQKISQILLKPVALVLSDNSAELSDAYIASLTATMLPQTEAAGASLISLKEDDGETLEVETAGSDSGGGAGSAPVQLEYVRPMSGGVHVLRLEPAIELEQARQLTERLSAREDVEYAEPDQPRRR